MHHMQELYKDIKKDKIKINWNKKPITMGLFLSFLTVKTVRQRDFLGSSNGWTKLSGDNGLVVCGGVVKGVEYLDSIQYGKKLDNPYNNYVNPFYLFEILNDDGKKFFLEYYSDDIISIFKKADESVELAENRVKAERDNRERVFNFWRKLRGGTV